MTENDVQVLIKAALERELWLHVAQRIWWFYYELSADFKYDFIQPTADKLKVYDLPFANHTAYERMIKRVVDGEPYVLGDKITLNNLRVLSICPDNNFKEH